MNVSNEQLLKDIENTIQEIEAYNFLRKGYEILARLPENQGSQSRIYYSKYSCYNSLQTDCSTFLEKLYILKEERGLD